MWPENCQYRKIKCLQEEECFLIVEMRLQAQTGGYSDSKLTVSCGPFWSSPIWQDFVNRNIEFKLDCGSADEMIAACAQITAEKAARNELIDP